MLLDFLQNGGLYDVNFIIIMIFLSFLTPKKNYALFSLRLHNKGLLLNILYLNRAVR